MPLRCARRPGSPFWWITGTIGGVRLRESTGTERRELAEEYKAKREHEAYRAVVHGAPAVRHTFGTVAASYLQHAGPHSAPTLARVNRLLVHLGAAIAADDVDQARLDKAAAELLRVRPSPTTKLREIISPVRAILTHGARRRLCSLPVFDLGKPGISRTEWLTPAEVDTLIACAAPHIKPLRQFLAASGARLSEALTLDWQDVDLVHGRVVLRETKNGRDRLVDLCPRASAALESVTGRKRRLQAVEPCNRTGRVFRTKVGEPYSVFIEGEDDGQPQQGGGQIRSAWSTAKRLAGIKRPVTPHSLRHTWASWHYAEHRDVMRLRQDGGWSSISLVERYTHLTPAGMAPAVTAWRAGTILTHALAPT